MMYRAFLYLEALISLFYQILEQVQDDVLQVLA